jgi:hypothetical protein
MLQKSMKKLSLTHIAGAVSVQEKLPNKQILRSSNTSVQLVQQTYFEYQQLRRGESVLEETT